MNESAIELSGVSYGYDVSPALQDVSLHVPKGEYLAVLGPNGGGKTTLLKLLLGLIQPSSGTVRVLGGEPSRASGRVGYMPQFTASGRAFPISVLQTVLMGRLTQRSYWPWWPKADRDKALECLARVGAAHLADKALGDLSGGQRQRVFIARALACGPELLLLDEPTASVDPEGRASLQELLGELAKSLTVVLVSHDISVISRHVTSVVCVNRTVHFHPRPEITPEMFGMMYQCGPHGCPVELIAHGIPHRILPRHEVKP
ncbi:metal ABC transporter ATP-binding protein [Fundidesulfovibrio terrae]|uniref:metal ABC transporter ATP-binding protein n=1 Tax=Fundidesulfovibrio terrae TaxID=2922866 RepID=UPI001FAEC928|nr:ABC transporter ATP-binding protein [Fundidesulfovibrio terrae]